MKVDLRVVGIFYNTSVEVPEGSTVKDVLVAAENQVTSGDTFSYVPVLKDGVESPESFRAFYQSGFSRGEGVKKRNYAAGTYELSENLKGTRESYTVWQYYIFKPKNELINVSQRFIPYDDKTEAIVFDAGRVVWRLVTVLKNSEEGLDAPVRGATTPLA
ncbi:MAG: hypothetical protein AAF382_16620 [Pseudomonadota bacterium]